MKTLGWVLSREFQDKRIKAGIRGNCVGWEESWDAEDG